MAQLVVHIARQDARYAAALTAAATSATPEPQHPSRDPLARGPALAERAHWCWRRRYTTIQRLNCMKMLRQSYVSIPLCSACSTQRRSSHSARHRRLPAQRVSCRSPTRDASASPGPSTALSPRLSGSGCLRHAHDRALSRGASGWLISGSATQGSPSTTLQTVHAASLWRAASDQRMHGGTGKWVMMTGQQFLAEIGLSRSSASASSLAIKSLSRIASPSSPSCAGLPGSGRVRVP